MSDAGRREAGLRSPGLGEYRAGPKRAGPLWVPHTQETFFEWNQTGYHLWSILAGISAAKSWSFAASQPLA